MVRIDEPGLGALYYSVLGMILVYVLVWPLLYQCKYLAFSDPVGAVRFNLQAPVVNNCDPTKAAPPCSYAFTNVVDLCAIVGGGCYTQPYCSQYVGDSPAPQQLVCYDWDALNVVEPVTGGQDIYMTTRVREDNETFVCGDPHGGSCASTYAIDCTNRSSTGQCRDYALQLAFIANIEEFTMLIEHSVRAANDEAVGATMASMNGYLLSCNGDKVMPAKTSQRQDILTVGDLLQHAQFGDKCGIDLDGPSTVTGSKHTTRYDGVAMFLDIEYINSKPMIGLQDHISYVYHVTALSGAKSKAEIQIFSHYPSQRIIRDQAGLKLSVSRSGQLGRFEIMQLLLQLSSSVAMFALATVVVDLIATNLLSNKAAYRTSKTNVYKFKGKHLEAENNLDEELLADD